MSISSHLLIFVTVPILGNSTGTIISIPRHKDMLQNHANQCMTRSNCDCQISSPLGLVYFVCPLLFLFFPPFLLLFFSLPVMQPGPVEPAFPGSHPASHPELLTTCLPLLHHRSLRDLRSPHDLRRHHSLGLRNQSGLRSPRRNHYRTSRLGRSTSCIFKIVRKLYKYLPCSSKKNSPIYPDLGP
jgi:hypothetical protein